MSILSVLNRSETWQWEIFLMTKAGKATILGLSVVEIQMENVNILSAW